ncbi:MAG TPA: RNase adapter RapZ [Motilibacteraceae bacterium]|nr:RNase adapter RapZ [Motilibacteraceae bacterium]
MTEDAHQPDPAPPVVGEERRTTGRRDRRAHESDVLAPPELLIVTGMSGAGRSTAADALEDLGWFVVDNLPPALLPRLADLSSLARDAVPKVAVVVDVRSRAFFADIKSSLGELAALVQPPKVLFLEAADDVLVRRFESSRRPHPLQGEGRVVDGIAQERGLLRDLRADADVVIDTSALNVHQLADKVARTFSGGEAPGLRTTVMSFGFKYGLPVDADLVVDCRFLPNPHWVPELRPLTGRDAQVSDYVLKEHGGEEFVDKFADVLRLVTAGYLREGKRYATLAVGCTGGKHRSVAVAEELGRRLASQGVEATVVHRDVGRE